MAKYTKFEQFFTRFLLSKNCDPAQIYLEILARSQLSNVFVYFCFPTRKKLAGIWARYGAHVQAIFATLALGTCARVQAMPAKMAETFVKE